MTPPRYVEDARGDAPAEGWPRFAFLIPTYNAAETIDGLLDDVAAQHPLADGAVEVVVADDCSSDDTAARVAAREGVRLVRLAVNGGPSSTRNAAAVASRADWLIFLDADVRLPADCLARVAAFVADHPDVGAFHWPMTARNMTASLVGLYKTLLDRHMTLKLGGGDVPVTFMSARGGAMRRDVFFASGGFDPTYRRADIEDWEFSRRLAPLTTIIHTDRLAIDHVQAPGLVKNASNYFRRAFLFTRLLARTQRMDNYTETTPLNSIATLGTLPMVLAAAAAPLLEALEQHAAAQLAVGLAGGLLGLFLLTNVAFFARCVHERGLLGLLLLPPFAALRLLFCLAVAAGVATAVVLWPFGGWPFQRRPHEVVPASPREA